MTVTINDMENAVSLSDFVQKTINDWLGSMEYATMQENMLYYFGENPTLKKKWKRIALDTGGFLKTQAPVNIYSNFFGRLTKQLVSRLLYHDIALDDEITLLKMGTKFQPSSRKIAFDAVISGRGWGFWDALGRNIQPKEATNLIPIIDDDTNKIAKAIYFGHVANDLNRTMIIDLYEPDGVTTWKQEKLGGRLEIKQEKTPYRYSVRPWTNEMFNVVNPSKIPIVPMYANNERRSELTLPIKTKINAYDWMYTFYTSEFLQSKFVYWLISGYTGNIEELVRIRDTARDLGILGADVGRDGSVDFKTLEPPYNAYREIMQALKNDIYADLMMFNAADVAGSANLATSALLGQTAEIIKAKAFEHEVEEFVRGMMRIAGVESTAVSLTQHIITDDAAKSQRLQGWVDRGVPVEEAIKEEPLFKDRLTEIEKAITKRQLSMDEVAIKEFERRMTEGGGGVW